MDLPEQLSNSVLQLAEGSGGIRVKVVEIQRQAGAKCPCVEADIELGSDGSELGHAVAVAAWNGALASTLVLLRPGVTRQPVADARSRTPLPRARRRSSRARTDRQAAARELDASPRRYRRVLPLHS